MSEKTSVSLPKPEQQAVDVYSAYLVARATGRPPVTRRDRPAALGEQYAVALGVEHFFRGVTTFTAGELLERTEQSCDFPEKYCENAEETRDLGPSPPDPGVTPPGGSSNTEIRDVEINTVIHKVEISVSTNQNPGQVARQIGAYLSHASRFRTSSPYTRSFTSTEETKDLGPSPPDPGIMLPGPWVTLGDGGTRALYHDLMKFGLLARWAPKDADVSRSGADVHASAVSYADPVEVRALTERGAAWIAEQCRGSTSSDPKTSKTDPPPPQPPDLLGLEDLLLRVKARCEAIQQQATRIENAVCRLQVPEGAPTFGDLLLRIQKLEEAPKPSLGPSPPDPGMTSKSRQVELSAATVSSLGATIAKQILDTPVSNYVRGTEGVADLAPSPPDPGMTAPAENAPNAVIHKVEVRVSSDPAFGEVARQVGAFLSHDARYRTSSPYSASVAKDLGPSPPDPGITIADLRKTAEMLAQNALPANPLAKLADTLDPNFDKCFTSDALVDEAIALIKSADERVTKAVKVERAACVAFLRAWPNAIPEILAAQIQCGQHRAP